MGFFSLFKRKRKRVARTNNEPGRPNTRESIRQVQGQIDLLNSHVSTIDVTLKTHDSQLEEHQALLQTQGEKLQSLEQRITSAVGQAPRLVARQTTESDRLIAQTGTGRKLDIDHFTEQQKRLLAVFFQNRSVEMSYADVARVLNKSAYTVKNQMNLIRQKADLFDRSIGGQSRSYFKLKDDLRIEKYLNLGRPATLSVSTAAQDQSNEGRVNTEPSLAPHTDPRTRPDEYIDRSRCESESLSAEK